MVKKMNISIKQIPHMARQVIFQAHTPFYKSAEENGYNDANTKISHVTYYACGNAGDTVLSACVRQAFRYFFPDSAFELTDVGDAVSEKKISSFNNSSCVVVGGGGLFLPDSNENTISGWQWAINEKQINEIHVPLVLFTIGYNYFIGQEPSELFIRNLDCIAEKSSYIGLRNIGSVKTVKALISPESREKISYQPCTTTIIDKLYPDPYGSDHNTGTVALNIAFDRLQLRLGSNYQEKLEMLASGVRDIYRRGYKIVYVAHCYGDLQFVQYLKKQNIEFKVKDMSTWFPQKVISFYRHVDMVIGMRGHAQMIPFGTGCEIITLGSHDKMKWFLEDIDATDWYIDLNRNDCKLDKELLEHFVRIHETEHESTQARLKLQREKLWDITVNNMTCLRSLLKKAKEVGKN